MVANLIMEDLASGTVGTQTDGVPFVYQGRTYQHLSKADIEHWMKYGFIVVRSAFSRNQAEECMSQLWDRLGYSPTDPDTWILERVNMPAHIWRECKEFSPKVWATISELCGGEDRIDEKGVGFGDNFICNFGREEDRGLDFDPRSLDNWHVDGDWFTHYLDSPEQSLLLIPIYTQIRSGGGGTVILPSGIPMIAEHLYQHPEGVSPRMVPTGQTSTDSDLDWFIKRVQKYPRDDFIELTGEIGDVVIMHPLMMHSAGRNTLRVPRVITNPAMSMARPFQYSRKDIAEYSLIELKTLSALGKGGEDGGLGDWKISGERKRLKPTRIEIQEAMRLSELKRLAGELHIPNCDKGYDINRLEGEVQ